MRQKWGEAPIFSPIWGDPLLLPIFFWRAIGCCRFSSFRKPSSRGMIRFQIIRPKTGAFRGWLRSRRSLSRPRKAWTSLTVSGPPIRRTLRVWWVAPLPPSVARTTWIRARRRRSPGTGFRSLARSFLSVLAAGGGGRWRLRDGINLWACRRGQWDEVLSAPRGVTAWRRQARRDPRVHCRRHRRQHRLLPTIDDPLDVSADAMLADPVDGEVATAVAAHMQALRRYRRRIRRSRLGRRRYIGSVRGRRPNKHRDFRSDLRAILRDYFGLDGSPPVYDEADFERRFRVPRSVFLRIYHAVKRRPFFAQRINATGRP